VTNAFLMKRLSWLSAVGSVKIFLLCAALGVLKLGALVVLSVVPQNPPPALAEGAAAPHANTSQATPPANASSQASPLPVQLQELREKEQALNQREASLRALEQELDRKLQELKALQAQVQTLLDKADVLKDEKIRHLVDVYSNMKPQQAGQALQALDEAIAVKILAGMTGRKAGEILSTVQPDKAARLSEALTRLQTPFGTP
jgi:flagellar motility protein MotE (MotC chaperone)